MPPLTRRRPRGARNFAGCTNSVPRVHPCANDVSLMSSLNTRETRAFIYRLRMVVMGFGQFEQLATIQAFVLACVLSLAGLAKVRIGQEPNNVRNLAIGTVLQRIGLSNNYHARLWQLVGIAESILALLLFSGRSLGPARIACACLFATGFIYVLWALRRAPGRPCGCFSATSQVTGIGVARCALLLASSIAALWGTGAWWSAISRNPPIALAACFEAAVVAALSSKELRDTARRLRRWIRPVEFGARGMLCGLIADRYLRRKLARSMSLQELLPASKRPTDKWREGCFYLVAYDPVEEAHSRVVVAAFHLAGPPYLRRLVSVDCPTDSTTVLLDARNINDADVQLETGEKHIETPFRAEIDFAETIQKR